MGAQQERRHALGDDQNDRGAHGARHQAADEARRFAELSPSRPGVLSRRATASCVWSESHRLSQGMRTPTPNHIMLRSLSLALAALSAVGAPVESVLRPDCEHVADFKLPGARLSDGVSVMCVHPPGEAISDTIRSAGMWDRELCKLIMHTGKRHGEPAWFVDVGANIGAGSVCAFNAGLNVISVEPAPWNFRMLDSTRTAHLGDKLSHRRRTWRALNVAMNYNAGGTMYLRANAGNLGGSSLVRSEDHPDGAKGWGRNPTHEAQIKVSSLDQAVLPVLPADGCISAMKIDVEGFELFALRGGTDLFLSKPPCHIFMEWHLTLLRASSGMGDKDKTPEKMARLLRGLGYETDRDLTQSNELVHWSLARPPAYTNCVCHHGAHPK